MTSDAIVIHIPFKSQDEFEVYRLEPFPFSLNQSVMELDLPASVVMVRSDFSLYATGTFSDLKTCKTGIIICNFVRHHYLLSYLSRVWFARWR